MCVRLDTNEFLMSSWTFLCVSDQPLISHFLGRTSDLSRSFLSVSDWTPMGFRSQVGHSYVCPIGITSDFSRSFLCVSDWTSMIFRNQFGQSYVCPIGNWWFSNIKLDITMFVHLEMGKQSVTDWTHLGMSNLILENHQFPIGHT